VTDNPTRPVSSTILLGDDPDAVELDARNGSLVIVLSASVSIVCDLADQHTLDRLATVTAEAAAVKRSRSLRRVA
jgi:hypothetical protein